MRTIMPIKKRDDKKVLAGRIEEKAIEELQQKNDQQGPQRLAVENTYSFKLFQGRFDVGNGLKNY